VQILVQGLGQFAGNMQARLDSSSVIVISFRFPGSLQFYFYVILGLLYDIRNKDAV
jgi:hypothetical protein